MTRFLRFCLVGATGVVVDMGALALLVQFSPLPPVLAKAFACEVAIVNNFVWNDRWTFRGAGAGAGRLSRFVRFNGVSLAGLALNVALFSLLIRGLGFNLYAANAVAIGLVAGFNYSLSRQWAWRPISGKLKADT